MDERRGQPEDDPRGDESQRPGSGWSARELADAAGTTIRTIHYYVAEGVLPPPQGERRAAVYPHAHLARLRLIAMLRDEGLSLAAIRARLAPLADRQAEALAAQMADVRHAQGEDASLLAHFEAALLDVGSLREGSAAYQSSPAEGGGGATAYVERLMATRRRNLRPSGPIVPHSPAPAPAPPASRQQAPASVPAPAPTPDASRATAASLGRLTDFDAAEAWYRLRLADGVDLHLRGDRQHALRQALSDPERVARLQTALDELRAALGASPPVTPPESDSD